MGCCGNITANYDVDGVQSSNRNRPLQRPVPEQYARIDSTIALEVALDESRQMHEMAATVQYEEDIKDAMEQSRVEQFKKVAGIERESEVKAEDQTEVSIPPGSSLETPNQQNQNPRPQASLSQFEDDRMDSVTVENMLAMGIYQPEKK